MKRCLRWAVAVSLSLAFLMSTAALWAVTMTTQQHGFDGFTTTISAQISGGRIVSAREGFIPSLGPRGVDLDRMQMTPVPGNVGADGQWSSMGFSPNIRRLAHLGPTALGVIACVLGVLAVWTFASLRSRKVGFPVAPVSALPSAENR